MDLRVVMMAALLVGLLLFLLTVRWRLAVLVAAVLTLVPLLVTVMLASVVVLALLVRVVFVVLMMLVIVMVRLAVESAPSCASSSCLPSWKSSPPM